MPGHYEAILWSLAKHTARGPRYVFRQTPDGLMARSRVWPAALLLPLGMLLVAYASANPGRANVWVPLAVGAAMIATGLLFVSVCEVFRLNSLERSWRRTRHVLFWQTSDLSGSFDDFEAIVLSEQRRPSGTWPDRFWVIALEFRNSPAFVDLFVVNSRPAAQARLQELGEHLGLPTRDRCPVSAEADAG